MVIFLYQNGTRWIESQLTIPARPRQENRFLKTYPEESFASPGNSLSNTYLEAQTRSMNED
jgi:hypothetical protein